MRRFILGVFLCAVIGICAGVLLNADDVIQSGGGGIARDLICAVAGCVDTADIADNAVTTDKVGFNYTTGGSEGAAAPTFHGVRLQYNAGNQTIDVSGTSEALSWDTEKFDTDGFHEGVTNPTRITIPDNLSGYYQINCNMRFEEHATGYRSVIIRVNGTTQIKTVSAIGSATASANVLAVSTSYFLSDNAGAANDYIECLAFQTALTDLDIIDGALEQHPIFEAYLVGL